MKKITLLALAFYSINIISQIKLTSSEVQTFNGSNWVSYTKNNYYYDANGNLISEEYLSNSGVDSDNWQINDKTFYSYNNQNLITEEIYQDWDVFTNTISYSYKTVYTYNTQNKLTEMLDYELVNNQWIPDYKVVISYNDDNQISEAVNYEWDGLNFVFTIDDSEKSTLIYNDNNQIIRMINEEWDGLNWNVYSKDDLVYNSDGTINSYLSSDYDGVSWNEDGKTEFFYDDNRNKIKEIYSEITDGSWTVSYEDNYTYDTSESMTSFIHPFKDKTGIEYIFEGGFIPYNNKLISSSYSSDSRTIYNYGEATANITKNEIIDFAVYPNPTTSFLKIDDTNLSIKKAILYNVLGKKVMITTANTMNLENLINGVYLLKIETSQGNIATKRIIKK